MKAGPRTIFSVALPVPLRTLFDYHADGMSPQPQRGDRVMVPFGNRKLIGIVCDIASSPEQNCAAPNTPAPRHTLKPIESIYAASSRLPKELLTITQWAAEYYQHPIGETILNAVPPYLRQHSDIPKAEQWVHTTEGKGLPTDSLKRSPKQQEIHQHLLQTGFCTDEDAKTLQFSNAVLKSLKEKGLIKKTAVTSRPNNTLNLLKEPPKTLNEEQKLAVDAIQFHQFQSYLLHGITGSGKTEVYLQLVARALQAGFQALVLVPEIGLSPQTVSRFRQRFAVPIVELHSGVSDLQRAKNWLSAKNGDAKIVIGTRLAAFCALHQPGIIIIDEEHDSSYKQQDGVRYSARDLSIYRAKLNHIPIILGSATPSLETLKNALEGHYQHLVLRHRATGVIAPNIRSIDLRDQPLTAGISPESMRAIIQTLANQQQVLVFQNRRGFAPMQLCHSCGWIAECPNCSANMTLHQRPTRLHCHHCDGRSRAYQHCPRCNSIDLDSRGVGTEQLEESLRTHFEGTTVLRIDRDSTRSKHALKTLLDEVHTGKPSILVGTQMLAKGHHFSNLGLVIVVDADQGFLNPDFRAMEKMGQLLMQVAGRAGRESTQGEVLIQTHRPDHPLIQTLLTRGYTHFARAILQERTNAQLPPYWHAAMFRAESKRADNALQLLELIKSRYFKHFPPSPSVQILGPLPAAIEKIQDRYRFQLQFSAKTRTELKAATKTMLAEIDHHALSKRVRWSIDIDPSDG